MLHVLFVTGYVSLVYCNRTGKGVPVDQEEAMKIFRLSADQGFPDALYNLGYIYHEQAGGKHSKVKSIQKVYYRRAFEWWMKAAELG